MALEMRGRSFTVDQYHELVNSGILSEDDRVELIEGEIVEMNPIGSPHAACVNRLNRLLVQATGERAIVHVQNPVRLGERTELQPDLALLKPRADFYESAHPGPDDILLLVEVADSSLEHDREVKLPLYARSGIPEVWLVDLEGQAVGIHRHPSPTGYREVTRLTRGVSLPVPSIPGLPNLHLTTDRILG